MPVISQPDKITKVLYQRSETKLSTKANATGTNADNREMLTVSGVGTLCFFLTTGMVALYPLFRSAVAMAFIVS